MSGFIRYLQQWEKQKTRGLYETAFPEDSRKFVDYYYQWKIRDNEIIVMEEDQSLRDDFFHVMIHLNPYTLRINGRQEKIPYLVAVATAPFCRRQGKMGRVMQYMLRDLQQKNVPFAFLTPADPAYYRGQGFVFFPDMNLTGMIQENGQGMIQAASAQITYAAEQSPGFLNEKRKYRAWSKGSRINWRQAETEDIPEMVRFSEKILSERHDMVISRDSYYYQRLLAETAVEHGGVLLQRYGKDLRGMLTYAVTESSEAQLQAIVEIKELLLEEIVSHKEAVSICRDALQRAGALQTPLPEIRFAFERMMVRITSLAALVPLLKSRRRRSLSVKVSDPLIEANNGCFHIILDGNGGRIQRTAEEAVAEEMDIASLTGELWKDCSVYLNEWV